MAPSHLFRVLASATLLLAVGYVSSESAKGSPRDPYVKNPHNCSLELQVGEGYGLAEVTLQDTLEFHLNPNMPLMNVNFLGEDALYRAEVRGTTVKLIRCDKQDSNCTLVGEGGTKDRDLLVPHRWNTIIVKYNNDVITVNVNGRAKVMGGHMRMATGPSKSSHVVMTFLVPPGKSSYMAKLEIPCTDTPPNVETELPALSTTTPATTAEPSSLPEQPYKDCPLYRVEVDHPSSPAHVHDQFTLAVYPNQPVLHLLIQNERLILKIQVDGYKAKLLQCAVVGGKCSSKDERNTDELFVIPEKWNYITLHLLQDNMIVSINEREVLKARVQSTYHKGLRVAVMAPRGDSLTAREHFVALVNIKCDETKQTTWSSGTVSTLGGLPTKAPIVETTPEPHSPGISRNVSIVVGVLVGVLLIIALAILISVVKKRRSANIGEHSPLQNQHQLQE